MSQVVIFDASFDPDAPSIGCQVTDDFRVDLGRRAVLTRETYRRLSKIDHSFEVGDTFYPVVVTLKGVSVPAFFAPKKGTIWMGKTAEEKETCLEVDRRIREGGDLYQYHEAIEALIGVRKSMTDEGCKQSEIDFARLSRAEMKRSRKAKGFEKLKTAVR